jgi:hypothetical protein
MSESDESTLDEILKWVKFMGMQSARDAIHDAVSDEDGERDDDRRIVYQLTDGNHSGNEIADIGPMGRDAVSSWQNKWASMGIVEKDSENTPYKHLISLDEVGIDYPTLPESEENEDEDND